MKGCARILAAICLVLFIVSAVIALLLVNIRFHLLSPETYSQAFSDAGVYEKLPGLAADQLLYGMAFNPCLADPSQCEGEGTEAGTPGVGEGGPPGYFSNLPEDVWGSILSDLIDPSWLEAQTESVMEQVFSILTEGSTQESIVLSLVEIKDRVRGEGGYRAVLNAIQAQPDCTLEQMLEITEAFASQGLSDSVLICRPSEDVMALVEPYVRSGLAEVVETLPASVEIDIPAELRVANSGAATALSIARAAFQFAPWIALFWLLAVTVFAVRDVRSWLGWWGSGLFMTGLVTGIMGAVIGPVLGWSLDRYLLSQGPSDFSPAVMTIALDVVDSIVSGYSGRVIPQAGLILGIGLLMLIFRLLTKPRNQGQIGQSLTEPRSQV